MTIITGGPDTSDIPSPSYPSDTNYADLPGNHSGSDAR
jgi:hypothetical protein